MATTITSRTVFVRIPFFGTTKGRHNKSSFLWKPHNICLTIVNFISVSFVFGWQLASSNKDLGSKLEVVIPVSIPSRIPHIVWRLAPAVCVSLVRRTQRECGSCFTPSFYRFNMPFAFISREPSSTHQFIRITSMKPWKEENRADFRRISARISKKAIRNAFFNCWRMWWTTGIEMKTSIMLRLM